VRYVLPHDVPFIRRIWRGIALAGSLIAYFVWFNWGSLRVHFALDDLSNIAHYYEYSNWQLVLSNFLPWRGDSRPMGGPFYIPIYHFAGLNPVPYQAAMLVLILITVYLVYRFARLLQAGEVAAGLAALIYCYHGGVANLYYNAAFVFDVLCCLFYLASFVYYLRIRERGELLGWRQTLIFLFLFLCALNSKEMAVSLPVMLLVYEWIYHRPATLMSWLRGSARVALIAGVLDLVDIYGKVAGPQAMIRAETYHPVFTLDRILAFQRTALQDLIFKWNWTPGVPLILGIWAALALVAWIRRDRPILRFLFFFLAVAPLPIEFLVGKSQACLVLLMVAGALFVSVVFADVVEWVSGLRAQGKPVTRQVLVGILIAAGVFVWVREQRQLRRAIGGAPMTTLGFETWDLIEQLRATRFQPQRGSTVAVEWSPLGRLDTYYLWRLWLKDRTLVLRVPGDAPQEFAQADYRFRVEDRRVVRVK
jgi:hypothetical protein